MGALKTDWPWWHSQRVFLMVWGVKELGELRRTGGQMGFWFQHLGYEGWRRG